VAAIESTRRDRPSVGRWELSAVVLGFLAVALWATWPVAKHPRHVVLGAGYDLIGDIATWQQLVHTIPFLPGRLHSFSAPDGLPIQYPLYISTWPSSLLQWVLSATVGAAAAENLITILGYTLTGAAVYWFVRHYLGDWRVAAAAGFAYSFRIDAILKGQQAPQLTHGWVLVLLLHRVIRLIEEPTRRNALYSGAASVLAASWSPYLLLIATVFHGTLLVTGGIVELRRRLLAVYALPAVVSFALNFTALVLYWAISKTTSDNGIQQRGLAQLYAYAAAPAEYLLPQHGNNLFEWARPAFDRFGPFQNDSFLYVGLVALALAVLAVVLALARRLPDDERVLVLLLAVSGIVAGIWSGPPTWSVFGRITLYLPMDAVGKLTTTWRVSARFGMLVSLCVVLLGAAGLTWLIRRERAWTTWIAVAAIAGLVLDTTLVRPGATWLSVPPIYATLKGLPHGIVAEYPVQAAIPGDYGQLYRQPTIGLPLVNGYYSGSHPEAVAVTNFANLGDPATPGHLAAWGVRYAIVPGGAAAPAPKGFRLVRRSGPDAVFQVVATPIPTVEWRDGFAPEDAPGSRWMTSSTGTVHLDGRCPDGRIHIHLGSYSLGQPRRLRLTLGAKTATFNIQTVPIGFDATFPQTGRQGDLHLAADPGPQSIDQALHNGDPRSVTVNLQGFAVSC
jgi:hypothetical protein